MLIFSLPMVKGEVNIVDFLLIEALRAFYPSTYDVVRDNQDLFVGTKLAGFDSANKVREAYIVQIERAYANLEITEKDSVKGLLTLLFPRLQTIYGNTSFLSEWDKTWAEEKRVASTKYFRRYFSYSVPANDISDREIESIISNIEILENNTISSNISDLLTPKNAEAFVSKLRLKASNLSEEVSKRLVVILSMLGERYPNPQQIFSFDTTFVRAAMLISHLIENVSSINERIELAEHVVYNGEPLPFVAEILRWIRTDKSRYTNVISKENIEILENLLGERVEKEALGGISMFDEFSQNATRLMYLWSNKKSRENANEYLIQYIQKDHQNLFNVLLCYVPIAYPMSGSELPHKSDFERDQYNNFVLTFDPDIIFNELQIRYGDELFSESYPSNHNEGLEMKVASQFMWLHRLVEKQKSDEGDPENSK